ncbi:MAG: AAA family ATPase [Nitrospirota bacterium]
MKQLSFTNFVGHEDAKLALILNAIDPMCGGVLFVGEKGCGKSTLSRLFRNLLPEEMPFVELPLNVTEDVLLGSINIEETIRKGRRVFEKGILCRSDGGVIYIDDVNLLPPEIVSLVLEVQSRGENIIEREGLTLRHPSRFILITSMNPEEGTLSSHLLDRFGMCVLWEGLKEKSHRIEIIKKAISDNFDLEKDSHLRNKIADCHSRIDDIAVPEEIKDYIATCCIENLISSHRGDIFLFYASRAYAAFCNDKEVIQKHVDEVLPLILMHRRRILQQLEGQREHQQEKHHTERDEKPDNQDQNDRNSQTDNPPPLREQKGYSEGLNNLNGQNKESSPKEEVFEPGNPFKARRFFFRKDRLNRAASGRRTKTKSKDGGGRYVKSILKANQDIAIDATLRAAAPFQKLRGRKEMLLIHDEDLRFKQREKKMGHLVIFIVDGSGSMGAQKRMIEAKGAIKSLLMDCYQKRDRVSMIVFRKDKAEVILPPTSSVEMASRRLREIPVGGKTPLTAGLLEAYKLIRHVSIKSPETRFLLLLITDGRANQPITEDSVGEEIKKMAQLLGELKCTDFIVIDTEDKSKFIKTDLALQVALEIGADYYTIDDLKADYLADIVQGKKSELFGV